MSRELHTEHLIGLPKSKAQAIKSHKLAVCLGTFLSHGGSAENEMMSVNSAMTAKSQKLMLNSIINYY